MLLNNLCKVILAGIICFLTCDLSFSQTNSKNSTPPEYLSLDIAKSTDVSFVSSREVKNEKVSYFKEFGILSGYGESKLNEKGKYKLIPLIVRFGFDLKPFLKKFNLNPSGTTELIWEPYVGHITQPDANFETGLNWLLKYSFSLTDRFSPYAALGLGMNYMTQHTYEQGTQFNFTQAVEGGFSFFLTKNTAFSLGFRFRHLSNSSIKKPNAGINSKFLVGGISWYY
jgi:opacity protein-like surface antigen